MRRTKPISSSVPAKQKRGGKRICRGKGARTLSWGWLYWSWVSKELLGGAQTLCLGQTSSSKASAAAGMGMVPLPRLSLSWCTHQWKNEGSDSKTGSQVGWGRSIPCSPGSKGFPNLSLTAGDGGTPHHV